ncbi:AMP-binding protein [Endozoicomonas arenosclerae]|uniref:AMP-binding protein n=1 Tax=Endozoicomonas arenosclerae TaxID=1633495 RepID=UPI000782D77C|nr:AMP-binding protein [Endozoicomonas arenosclerae]
MDSDFWTTRRPRGVSDTIDVEEYSSLVELIDGFLTEHSNKPAYTCLGKTLTFTEVDEYSRRLAGWFQKESGLKPGDRLAIQLPNLLQYPIVAFAALRVGLVVVNVNPLYTLTELKHQLADSGTQAIVCLSSNVALIREASDGSQKVINTDPLDLIQEGTESTLVEGCTPLLPILNNANADDYSPYAEARLTDLAMLQYTGGTTGFAKGAMLSHGNLLANLLQYRAITQEQNEQGEVFLPTGKQVIITPLPLYHIFAFTVNMLMYGSRGDENVLIPNPRDIDQFIKVLNSKPFTVFAGLNTLFSGLLAHPEFSKCDFSHLVLTMSGGTALKQEVNRQWQETTGVGIIEGYGLTECSPVVSVSPIGPKKDGTVGQPVPETELKLVKQDGSVATLGEQGELCVRGPQIMMGYWNNPEATAKTIDENGWFYTGDVAQIDSEGFISIVDRLKDMVLVSGFNVYPNEIEDVVTKMDGVQYCAAIGVPDEKTGEAVKLFVVKGEGELSEEKVVEWCRQHLTPYKVPRHIEFRSALPMTAVGKILRKDLKEDAV